MLQNAAKKGEEGGSGGTKPLSSALGRNAPAGRVLAVRLADDKDVTINVDYNNGAEQERISNPARRIRGRL